MKAVVSKVLAAVLLGSLAFATAKAQGPTEPIPNDSKVLKVMDASFTYGEISDKISAYFAAPISVTDITKTFRSAWFGSIGSIIIPERLDAHYYIITLRHDDGRESVCELFAHEVSEDGRDEDVSAQLNVGIDNCDGFMAEEILAREIGRLGIAIKKH